MPELVAWLLTPISGTTEHLIQPVVAWHGRIMVLCWGVAIPLAVLIARFFKVTPRQQWPHQLDNKTWWTWHRALNYTAVAASLIAGLLVLNHDSYSGLARQMHEWMGWTIVVSGLLQVLVGNLRGTKGGPTDPRIDSDGQFIDLHGDHYDMTPRRVHFERFHKGLGYMALLLAAGTMYLGLWTADAPRWMWIGIGLWWAGLACVGAKLQANGRCLDTYQAIWGPDDTHPGNNMPVIGWGIRRERPGTRHL
ncbi:cytochrome b561 domain-containing protein [Comamonas thiooxydans]|uniref:cytochrome b561 domain-containing protein n=1 Tax=Comamonas thiooxydans TaxID=363952 RepID=UPI0020CC2CD9|nr:cytochrome b561 domain-containing protein [Comamonas thiooxydans]BDR09306.1 cytochrome b561 domain-containing protein [Comamonas thiooxydans]